MSGEIHATINFLINDSMCEVRGSHGGDYERILFWVVTPYLCVVCFTALSVANHTTSNGKITDGLWIRKGLEGSGRDLIQILSRYSPGETAKIRPE
jgi:hypothetical protein